ncbi:MAG TPA: hypothetical protein VFD56_01525 [Chitinophagaceae bacterium]|nr:hypothetical protein [Chitinophagaceae bacterium]
MNNLEDSGQSAGGIMDSYSDTQREILAIETRKTRNKLFFIGAVILISDLLGLLMANAVNATTLLFIAIVPLVFVGLGLLATKEPLLAMILGTAVIVALWVFTYVQFGNRSLISGILVKAILITLLISGFRNAIEANTVRKEMR